MKVEQIVTEKILEALDKGVVPWKRPWGSMGPNRSWPAQRPYSGVNALLLGMAVHTTPFWATFNQIKKAGGSVKKGEKGTMVVFWKILEKPDLKDPEKTVTIPFLRYYKVFNLDQTEGIDVPSFDVREHQPLEEAEAIVRNMPNAPTIQHGGEKAVYRPGSDSIQIPAPGLFETRAAYYCSLFHELVHSTGHETRLDRKEKGAFGSDAYAREELVAEIGAGMLCAHVGLDTTEENAAYIDGWRKRLNDDPRLVVWAASRAQKAVEYILGKGKEEN